MANTLGVKILERLRDRYGPLRGPVLALDLSCGRARTEIERLIDEVVDEHQVHISVVEQAARNDAFEECAKIARDPYGDAVEAYGGDEPHEVGLKIAKAIRARKEEEGG